MNSGVHFEHPEYRSELLEESLHEVLEANRVLAMATVRDGAAHINAAFYCFNANLDVFFLSDELAIHSQNLAENESVAATVYDSTQSMGVPKRGVQIFGACQPAGVVQATEALRLWVCRFPEVRRFLREPAALVRGLAHQRFYVIRPTHLKLLDEVRFGKHNPIPVLLCRCSGEPRAAAVQA